MFSIYGETGRVFQGAMEDLWHVEAIREVARVRAVAPHAAFRRPSSPATPTHAQMAQMPDHLRPGARGALAAYAHAGHVPVQRHPLSQVRDVMSPAVFTVAVNSTVQYAWQQLAEHGLGQAPVVDSGGVLVGLVSRADLLRPDRLPSADSNSLVWRALLAQAVSSIMWTPVPAVDAQTDLRRVARVLLDAHLPGLPVVDETGIVTAFISRTDILRAVVHDPPLDLWS
jgi:CBS domain-containing protein